MANIIHTSGEFQLNTPYETDKELQDCGLTDWRIATDEEVIAYKNSDAYKQQQNQIIHSKLDALDAQAGCNRSVREVFINLNQNGFNDIFLNTENQAKELRKQQIT